jgi:hypothetical protein
VADIPVKVPILRQINIVKFGDSNRHEVAGILSLPELCNRICVLTFWTMSSKGSFQALLQK